MLALVSIYKIGVTKLTYLIIRWSKDINIIEFFVNSLKNVECVTKRKKS